MLLRYVQGHKEAGCSITGERKGRVDEGREVGFLIKKLVFSILDIQEYMAPCHY